MNEPITWTPITVKLGDLKPWQHNPRQSTKKQAQKILQSWQEFGQVETVAVGPDLDVYNGHQRLGALLTLHGPAYTVDARQSSRALSEDERKRLTVYLHAGAVGSWDWDLLSGWEPDELIGWGLDDSALADWRRDTAALGEMLGSEVDYEAEWQGMPEFEHVDLTAWKSIVVHFSSSDNFLEFAKRLDVSMTNETKSFWFPDDGLEPIDSVYE